MYFKSLNKLVKNCINVKIKFLWKINKLKKIFKVKFKIVFKYIKIICRKILKISKYKNLTLNNSKLKLFEFF